MSNTHWITLTAKLIKGYGVASGPSEAYPDYGSIEKQKPYFKALGLNLDNVFNGTLNISIDPYQFKIENPQYTFKNVKWTDLTQAEDFSFSACMLNFQDKQYNGWVYYPSPKTKPNHFQSASTIEVLAPHILEINYGDTLDILLNSAEIKVTKGT